MNGRVKISAILGGVVLLGAAVGAWSGFGLPLPVSDRTLADHTGDAKLQFAQLNEKQADLGIKTYERQGREADSQILYWTTKLAETADLAARLAIQRTLDLHIENRDEATRKVKEYTRQKIQASQ